MTCCTVPIACCGVRPTASISMRGVRRSIVMVTVEVNPASASPSRTFLSCTLMMAAWPSDSAPRSSHGLCGRGFAVVSPGAVTTPAGGMIRMWPVAL